MQRIIMSLAMLAVTVIAVAQGKITGIVQDGQTSEPLGFVNIRITQTADSSFVGGATSDMEGKFTISNLKQGRYLLTASSVGYKPLYRKINVTSTQTSINLGTLIMQTDAKNLKEVTVTGMRSTMKLEVDRKVFDVSQLITNAGNAASDILDNIPSVEVDNDGNVSLRGNSSVEVWINGKASGLTSDNRAQILQQLPAESIERIEVIDNPSAKFSAEGSAGVINIILKKNLKPGYYGSVELGGDTQGGGQTSFNINYNSGKLDAYFNIGLRHREDRGLMKSEQFFPSTQSYQNYDAANRSLGNNLFTRAGLTWHATNKDDFSIGLMGMKGMRKSSSITPYHYGNIKEGIAHDNYILTRDNYGKGDMNMLHGELGYKHSFTDKHTLEAQLSYNSWSGLNENIFRDSTTFLNPTAATTYHYLSRPLDVKNHSWEAKLDYENALTDNLKLQAGYQGNFSRENTPQLSYEDNLYFDGRQALEDQAYFNRFIYNLDIHALYTTLSYKLGKLGVMAGLRGEYWTVNTESYDYQQEHNPELRQTPFKKNYFELFPSLFLTYQLTPSDQLQLNYTRRLRRPWGGQLNSFRNTSDATTVSFGNPLLTPEFSHSFSLNYLKTWDNHSLLLSGYYRPTTDVMQRISYRNEEDGLMYTTNMNLTKSQSLGAELTVKNRLFKVLELTTNLNAYDFKLDGFSYDIDGQTVYGKPSHSFTWNARMTASVLLPYDISIQAGGRYRSKQLITQGYRKPNYAIDLGIRKNFFDKKLTVAISCRDLLNSRRWETFTESDNFTRHQLNRRGSRKVNLTLTWNFGNTKKKRQENGTQYDQQGNDNSTQGQPDMGDE